MKKILWICLILIMSFSINAYAENEETIAEQQETFGVNDFLEDGNIRTYIDGTPYIVAGLDDFIEIFVEEFYKIGVYFGESEVRK